ncbi:hypothetical protein BE21_23170 [Sorangium cellulosum]|uniref:Uncharacterized protein n=2 Tax=Sorangium cellulosum TaxID=56 RepID=A0A150TV05_SORCE|nr:hypothetical protein SCE1572_50880 [Sorangium cellulosum So0157-2]KYG08529.1 hypothetical protein BE21_23170 [Sorangium cellulosum]
MYRAAYDVTRRAFRRLQRPPASAASLLDRVVATVFASSPAARRGASRLPTEVAPVPRPFVERALERRRGSARPACRALRW